MTDDLKSGDVVRIKSGGPKMTVVHRSTGIWFDCVWFDCVWFDETGAAHARAFRRETLERAT